jgi:hypothetical protein
MIHKWEEPALAGNGGSGAIFFGGCTLGCVYCQNRAISAQPCGTPTDSRGLREMMEQLIARGAENIDLVSPTPYLPTILPALEPKLPVPVVCTGGQVMTVASAPTLDEAADAATLNMMRMITENSSLDPQEAGMLLTLKGELGICQIVDPMKTARMEFPLEILSLYGFRLP